MEESKSKDIITIILLGLFVVILIVLFIMQARLTDFATSDMQQLIQLISLVNSLKTL